MVSLWIIHERYFYTLSPKSNVMQRNGMKWNMKWNEIKWNGIKVKWNGIK